MKDDYDLSELQHITVRGFDYQVMPRYLYHYTDKEYERFSLDLLDILVEDGSTTIDIGAHYGIYSLLAARKSKKVYAFEPVPENFEVLKKNIAQNKLRSVITPINKAVSDSDGEVEFNVTWASDSAGFYQHPNAEVIRKIKVQMAAIDHELKDVKDVSFIKIDTEGHEIHVLQGMRSTLRNNPQAKLLIEFNPECLVNAGTSAAALVETIIDLGYDIFALHEDQRHMVRVQKHMSEQAILQGLTYLNFLCLPAGSWRNLMFVSHSSELGGSERVLLETVKDLLYQKSETFSIPYVVVPGSGPLTEKLGALPVPLRITHMRGWTGESDTDAATADENRRMNSGAVVILSGVVADFQPQVICSNTMTLPLAALVAKAYDVPHVWSIHEFGDLDHGLHFDYGYQESLRFISSFADIVTVNSRAVQRHVASYIVKDKTRLLRPQVKPPQVTEKLASPFSRGCELKLAIVGRVMSSKGQLDAVKALQALRKRGVKAELLIIGPQGSKEYWQEISGYLKQHALEAVVHIAGFQDNPTNLLTHADVALVCSSNEAYGMVTVEAMLLGKPVVAANSGGTTEIVEDGVTGLLYEPQTVQDLAEKLLRLTDKALRNRMGVAAKKAALELNQDYTSRLLHFVDEAKHDHQSVGAVKGLTADLLAGARSQGELARQEREELTQAHNNEIQRFSAEYNKVYAAYNETSRQLTLLEGSKVVRARRKLGNVKRKLGRIRRGG